ncbi:mandelate racemase/muconate lactonizing enzyme family protein [Pelagibius sp. CAU 1746]|uniref:mandelate racemase/muconate lactonizing enzyme family protein n=1 Tax=Pelagibius sp. CAU 1746 TaxID=3140370 RepID=UPI00325B8F1C
MKIETVDFWYLRMPVVENIGDGSQDALLVRARGGGHEGWGECEAAPLTSIAAAFAPMSHEACKPVLDGVIGAELNDPSDIHRLTDRQRRACMDHLQAPHTWSGIEIALWDLLGKARGAPVWSLLGHAASHPKRPYASALFADDPQGTLENAQAAIRAGFSAAKFGWGPFGMSSVTEDRDHVQAAREGLGPDALLLVDAGQAFGRDVDKAHARMAALSEAKVGWLEEPFGGECHAQYAELKRRGGCVPLAGGEAAHSFEMAEHAIEFGQVDFIQIDTGRIGGIAPAARVAELAAGRDLRFVNHTFTSQLALSASLQPFAGYASFDLCEYPAAPKQLAIDIAPALPLEDGGRVRAPDAPGLGVSVDLAALKPYIQDVAIEINGETLYRTPPI